MSFVSTPGLQHTHDGLGSIRPLRTIPGCPSHRLSCLAPTRQRLASFPAVVGPGRAAAAVLHPWSVGFLLLNGHGNRHRRNGMWLCIVFGIHTALLQQDSFGSSPALDVLNAEGLPRSGGNRSFTSVLSLGLPPRTSVTGLRPLVLSPRMPPEG